MACGTPTPGHNLPVQAKGQAAAFVLCTELIGRPAMVGKWRRNRSSGSVSTIGIGSSLSFAGNLRLRDDRRCSSTVGKHKGSSQWHGNDGPGPAAPLPQAQPRHMGKIARTLSWLEVGSTSTSGVIGCVLARALRSTLPAAAFRKR